MTVHIDVLLAAICFALGGGFALGVLIANTSKGGTS